MKQGKKRKEIGEKEREDRREVEVIGDESFHDNLLVSGNERVSKRVLVTTRMYY